MLLLNITLLFRVQITIKNIRRNLSNPFPRLAIGFKLHLSRLQMFMMLQVNNCLQFCSLLPPLRLLPGGRQVVLEKERQQAAGKTNSTHLSSMLHNAPSLIHTD